MAKKVKRAKAAQQKKAPRMKRARKAGKPSRRGARRARSLHHSTIDMQPLLHELQVHAEEITVQNEQLLKTQDELEEARDRFAALYDFAPIGYISLDRHGVITEINLTGATMLGRPRMHLINLPLSALVAREDRDRLARFVSRAYSESPGGAPSVEVTARTDGQHVFRLIARVGVIAGGSGQLLTAMMDVTEERRLESERQARAADLEREVSERMAAETRVKMLLERLVTAQEEERRRLARNLHDHMGQQLTALGLALESLTDDTTLPEPLRRRMLGAQEIVKQLDKDVDLLAWDLRPAVLDLGLGAALADLVRQWTSATEIAAEFHQSPGDVRLPPRAEANVYRIVQEALNNVAKHAAATHVSVLFEHRADDVAVIIEDDGRGFDPDLASQAQSRHAGMGLLSMRERAAQFDGTVQIESAPGQGTTVFVRIPGIAASPDTPEASPAPRG